MMIRNWYESLAVASECHHFEGLVCQVKRSTKSHEAELFFVRGISCEFVDRACPSGN